MTLSEAEKLLKSAGIENYMWEAKVLASSFCGVSPAKLLACKNENFVSSEFENAVKRRCGREPLQYIVGKWDFMNETYIVNEFTLIPRQDTETLVEFAVSNIPKNGVFADLCAGSGCVGISTLAARRDLSCVSVEKYPKTLEVARENAKLNGVSDRISFSEGDVTSDVFGKNELFDAVLSNPPYIDAAEYETLSPEVKKEPKAALTDGGDGMSVIEKIFEIYPAHLKNGGFIAVETGFLQGERTRALIESHGMKCELIKDIEGRDRVAVARKTDTPR